MSFTYPSSPGSSSSVFIPFNSPSSNPVVQPVTRSRTLFYLSIRDSSIPYSSRRKGKGRQYGETLDVADEEQGLMDGQDGRSGLPPRWVDISEEVEEILSRLKPKIAQLDKLHAKHVLPGFTDRTAEEREIERQTSEITRDFRKCSSLIGTIVPSRKNSRVETLTAKNVQRGLAQKVQDASGQFRKKQRVYMQKLQGHAIKNKDILAASGAIKLHGPEGIDELKEDEEASQMQSQSQVAVDIDIDKRTKEITQIASSISELADLFRDLGNLVVAQGTVLDSVEYNVQTTARELTGAVEELKTAQRYQANTGRRKCILFLVLCIVGVIIVLIYKPRSHDAIPVVPSDSTDYPVNTIHSEYYFIPSHSRSHIKSRPTKTRRPVVRPSPLPDYIGDDEE
ncbi:syntaxin 16 [Tremella mesenterica]|uniref:Syntaxin 16 n=1 Tax=Tremella mesenterica TaxID=5217 RepID=A0A4Q1BIT9_TREME|nr:syntaxin 16 [Tremella mesenterica]